MYPSSCFQRVGQRFPVARLLLHIIVTDYRKDFAHYTAARQETNREEPESQCLLEGHSSVTSEAIFPLDTTFQEYYRLDTKPLEFSPFWVI